MDTKSGRVGRWTVLRGEWAERYPASGTNSGYKRVGWVDKARYGGHDLGVIQG